MPGMDYIKKSAIINHYKRLDIRKEMLREAENKEIAVSYAGKGYGKRPDTLMYENDILQMVKKGATSFHASEELWSNPQQIITGASRQELNDLRSGWDLVIDIDCPYWKLAKVTTWVIAKALQDFGIKSVSAKFSGNKGFHIGVPFEAFPKRVHQHETKNEFPEDPRKIALFLLDYISRQDNKRYIHFTESQEIIFGQKYKMSMSYLQKLTGKRFDELTSTYCGGCGNLRKQPAENYIEFLCPKCGHSARISSNEGADYMSCPNMLGNEPCGTLMEMHASKSNKCACGSSETYTRFNPLSIIDMDTLLISSRHLYRMTYSIHEKSNLVSVPVAPEEIMNFSKEQADPSKLELPQHKFLDRSKATPGEANNLLISARDFKPTISEDDFYSTQSNKPQQYDDLLEVEDAISEDLFPPCIKLALKGLEDGRKRALFIFLNFLGSVGWSHEAIKKKLYEWNKNNDEALREVIIKGQLRHRKDKNQKVLPPNCDNPDYYSDLKICQPDEFCPRIKNPAQYTKLKAKLMSQGKKKKK